jgi:hypothetical protein
MDSEGHTHATGTASPPKSGGPPPMADSVETGPSPAEAFREALRHFAEIREYAGFYVAAKIDAFRLGIRNVIFLAALAVLGLIAAAAVIVTAVVLSLEGVAGALAVVMPLWAANLIIGVAFLLVLALAILIVLSRLSKSSRLQTVNKYESRKQCQQTRFGHDVNEPADGPR